MLADGNLAVPVPSVKPASFILACGDGNAALEHLRWTSWTATAATATGSFTHNTCIPDCADGTFVSAPATVRLSYPMQTGAGMQFSTIRYTHADRSAPGSSRTVTVVGAMSPG